MTANTHLRTLIAAIAIAGAATLLSACLAIAQATSLPTHLITAGHIAISLSRQAGVTANIHLRWITGGMSTVGVLTVFSTCIATAQATPLPLHFTFASRIAAGFSYPESVTVDNDPQSPEYSDVYVADKGNHRMQVLSPSGAFVEMFGAEVNATTKGNICTAASNNTCQPGANGSAPGQFSAPYGVTIDPSNGDVYVAEYVFTEAGFGLRVQKLTAEGAFLYEIGKEVNTTKDKEVGATEAEKNLCSEVEIEKGGECGGPAQDIPESLEDGSFNFDQNAGNLIAVGGENTKDLLYVGDEHRVQEFEAASGKWVGEIPLTSIPAEPGSKVQALALDPESGDVYLSYPNGNVVHVFNPEGNAELSSIVVKPLHEGEGVSLQGMAVDASGRLAVVGSEGDVRPFGSLYDTDNGHRVSAFAIPTGVTVARGIGISSTDDLYAASYDRALGEEQEVLVYKAEPIGELAIGSSACESGAEHESSATFDCTLNGEANPEGVSETEALFEWGRTPDLGEKTPSQPVAATGPLHTVVSLRPNEEYYYSLSGFDHNLEPPEEAFSSEEASLTTDTVASRIIGLPTAPTIRSLSAVLFSELNPENAQSEYFFEYAQAGGTLAACTRVSAREQDCAGVSSTPILSSGVYGKIGASAEVTSLQPDTTYDYRLFVENESRTKPGEHLRITGPEASFTTALAPSPSAQTGAYGAVTPTSAIISGAVNPDGLAAGYAFELGVYNGANTQYTIVSSGSAGLSNEPVSESYALSGLQPGTTYAYRISVSSGYILNESHTLQGASAVFTTAGAATVLVAPPSLPILATPVVPPEPKTSPPAKKCKQGHIRNKHGACVKKKTKKKVHKTHKAHRSGTHKVR